MSWHLDVGDLHDALRSAGLASEGVRVASTPCPMRFGFDLEFWPPDARRDDPPAVSGFLPLMPNVEDAREVLRAMARELAEKMGYMREPDHTPFWVHGGPPE